MNIFGLRYHRLALDFGEDYGVYPGGRCRPGRTGWMATTVMTRRANANPGHSGLERSGRGMRDGLGNPHIHRSGLSGDYLATVSILRACGGWYRRCRPVLDGGEQQEGRRGKAAAGSISPGMVAKCDTPRGSKI